MILWRPVGLKELALMFDARMRAFPPRLPEQPIFYPVLNSAYAEQIARDWNTQEPDAAGYVTKFEIPDDYGSKFERRVVGAQIHEELWVPAEELAEFNSKIEGPISVESAYFGPAFRGIIPEKSGIRGKTATEQFAVLSSHFEYSSFDVWFEIAANAKVLFLNFPFFGLGCTPAGRVLTPAEQKLLEFIRHRWMNSDFDFELPSVSIY